MCMLTGTSTIVIFDLQETHQSSTTLYIYYQRNMLIMWVLRWKLLEKHGNLGSDNLLFLMKLSTSVKHPIQQAKGPTSRRIWTDLMMVD